MSEPRLILYQRDDCHLCDLALETLAQARVPAFESVFIDGDVALEARYGVRVPVLQEAGGRTLDWPFDVVTLRTWLASLALLVHPLGSLAAPVTDDVNLAKPGHGATARWSGVHVEQVLPAGSIQRLVVTRAVTSAPGELDAASVREVLTGLSGPALDTGHRPRGLAQMGHAASIWEGVIVLASGTVMGFVIDADMVCLHGAEGEQACWTR
ncbi:glutaredoxin family protein [Luteimonas sp. SJ-16]|uniref:Glutaredoxin family protein n=1 Tax=Luteimonas deserti TaxID=2752306 RepID=A0A7Z0TZR5_9GAMM|nr:glutaredoxin family protein [Luteimonas deserti]